VKPAGPLLIGSAHAVQVVPSGHYVVLHSGHLTTDPHPHARHRAQPWARISSGVIPSPNATNAGKPYYRMHGDTQISRICTADEPSEPNPAAAPIGAYRVADTRQSGHVV
jgi:hypothetical protein